jgi:hypothetical protein
MGGKRNADKILLQRTERKRQYSISVSKLEDNIKMYFKEIGYEGVDWIHLAQDMVQQWAIMNTLMNLRVR